jgi:hypothetical protein
MKSTKSKNSRSNSSRTAPASEPCQQTSSRPLSRPRGRGRADRSDVVFAPVFRAATRRVPPPETEEIKPETPWQGLLGNLFTWLRGRAPARRQLRLVETVPLGEKRFVAIIHAEGRKYLVGGGASGVALLTSLDEPASQHNSIAPLAAPVEVAG